MTEAELVLRAQQGDAGALGTLIRQRWPWILKQAAKFTRPGLDEGELVAVAAVATWTATMRYDWTRGPFPPFLALTVRRKLVQYVVRESRRNVLHRAVSLDSGGHEGEPLHEDHGDGQDGLGPERAAEVQALLEAIDPRAAGIVFRRYLRGWTIGEVAQVLGVSRERVRQIEVKAMAELRTWAR